MDGAQVWKTGTSAIQMSCTTMHCSCSSLPDTGQYQSLWPRSWRQLHSDCARHFLNRCDIYKVVKLVHGNLSDDNCNWSGTLPSIDTSTTRALLANILFISSSKGCGRMVCLFIYYCFFENWSSKVTDSTLEQLQILFPVFADLNQ